MTEFTVVRLRSSSRTAAWSGGLLVLAVDGFRPGAPGGGGGGGGGKLGSDGGVGSGRVVQEACSGARAQARAQAYVQARAW